MRKRLTSLAGLAAVSALAVVGSATPAGATHSPADKVAVSASHLQSAQVGLTAGSQSQTITLATARMKTSSPTDLVFQFTAECALQTDIKVSGNDSSQAIASADVWIEVDGTPVPVSALPAPDNGKVTFCNRDFKMSTSQFDDLDATIALYLKTKAAHGFNWVKLNLGSGEHTIEVKANLKAEVTGTGEARVHFGKRTLVVEPAKLANDAIF